MRHAASCELSAACCELRASCCCNDNANSCATGRKRWLLMPPVCFPHPNSLLSLLSPSLLSFPPLSSPVSATAPIWGQSQFGGDDGDTYNDAAVCADCCCRCCYCCFAVAVTIVVVGVAVAIPDCSVCASNCNAKQLEREASTRLRCIVCSGKSPATALLVHVEWLLKRFVQLNQLFVISLSSISTIKSSNKLLKNTLIWGGLKLITTALSGEEFSESVNVRQFSLNNICMCIYI